MIQEALPETQLEIDRPHRRSILVVDDDPDQVVSLALRLEKQGYHALTAHAGKSCLTIAHAEHPDLIILDVHLPDLDGLQVCERLSDSTATCDIPVIILTGMSRPDIVRCSRAAGCTYFVCKPFDPNALLTLIEQSIDGRGGFDWA